MSRACALAAGDELGHDVGARLSLMSHGWLGVAALSAPTLGGAIAVLAEHFALVSPLFAVSVHVEQGSIAMRFTSRWPLADDVQRHHLAVFYASLRAHLPSLALVEHDLRVPAALADVRLPLADAHVHGAALRRCRSLLAARPDPTGTAAMVRRVLIASGAPFPDLAFVAKRLATSSRSLRRRLQEEGTSFRAILDDVRSTIADEWLDDPKRSITEIGLDLGYTDAANFTRAYRRANGQSPSAARKQRFGLAASA